MANYFGALFNVSNTMEAVELYEKAFDAKFHGGEIPADEFVANPIADIEIHSTRFILHPGESTGDNVEIAIGFESEGSLRKAYYLLIQEAGDYGIYTSAHSSQLFAVVWCTLNYESKTDLLKSYGLLIQEAKEYYISTEAHWTTLHTTVIDKYGIRWRLLPIDNDEVSEEQRNKHLPSPYNEMEYVREK